MVEAKVPINSNKPISVQFIISNKSEENNWPKGAIMKNNCEAGYLEPY